MKRPIAITGLLVTLAVAGCGDDDKNATTTSPPPAATTQAPDATPPPSAAGQLPPAFLKCMADQGYEITSPAEIHSAPPQVLQACFQTMHGGGSQ